MLQGLLPVFQPLQNLRWRDSGRFIWTEGLQTLFVFQRLGKDPQDRGGILHPLGVQGALSHPEIPCSGSALLLLLQADSCAPGRPSLLPGFTLAPQGICSLPWLMDLWNPLECPCTPQALSGSVPAHPFSWDFGNRQEAFRASLHFRATALVGSGMFLETIKE